MIPAIVSGRELLLDPANAGGITESGGRQVVVTGLSLRQAHGLVSLAVIPTLPPSSVVVTRVWQSQWPHDYY